MTVSEILLFGPFQFDPQAGRLTKYGHRIKLQPKSVAILSCLLQHPGEIVRHPELQDAVWPEGTYVDFELGIRVGVKKLRDTLGDLSAEPVYIQTIYGEGYKFIAPVRSKEAATLTEAVPAADAAIPEAPPHVTPIFGNKVFWAGAIATAAVVVALSILSWVARSNPLHFQNRDWVVIAAFENRTAEKLLDGSMEFALARELSHSSYLNVAPPDRIADALALMRQKSDTVLTEQLAREVAVRDGGIRAVLAGRVERFGKKYVLTVRVVNPLDGQAVAVIEKEGDQEQLPAAARNLAEDLRRKLGEPVVRAGATQAQRLEQATTPSLTALAAFSAGMRNVNENKWLPATELLEEAVRRDPQFALAHIYAAHCYSNLGQAKRAGPHYEMALQLSPGVSDRERLFILGSYYSRALQDDRRAQGYYEALLSLYPDDYWGVNNLRALYVRLGMTAELRAANERVVALRPRGGANWSAASQLWWYYRRDQPDPAKARQYFEVLRRWRSEGAAGDPMGLAMFDADSDLESATDRWWRGDVEGAARELARVSTRVMPLSDHHYTNRIALANLVVGRIGAARRICGQLVEIVERSECLLRVDYAADNPVAARDQLHQLQISGPSQNGVAADVALAIHFGEIATAKRFALAHPHWNYMILLAEGHPQEAFEQLSKLRAQPSAQGASWVFQQLRLALATVRERQGNIDEAIALLVNDTRPNEAAFVVGWEWPACRLKLAELYRKAGRMDEAAKTEEEIRFHLLAADADHPVLLRLGNVGATPARTMKE